jgi:threonylcarbamoyladenosine tRNA methylthiotransferase CDKAL1
VKLKYLPLRSETEQSVPRVFVEGHGCSASFADTEIITGLIGRAGYEVIEDENKADVSVLVTCSVKTVTEQRMLSRIRELSQGGKRKVVVAGCLAKAEPQKVLALDHSLSLVGPNNLDKVVPAIESTLKGSKLISLENNRLAKVGLPRTRKNNTIGIVEIASGCLSSCTFCQVKLVKGTVFSYPEEGILDEVAALTREGVSEIWLTSTDNSAYGRDSRSSLAKLLERTCAIEGNFRVRVGMMNPLLTRSMQSEVITAFKHEKVFKFLHLPVQSGSDGVLKWMQRGYTSEDYYSTVECFRSEIPDLTLSTDMIVGFPGESESDFEDSLKMLQRSTPDIVNLSRFGAREGTKAAKMDSQIRSDVAKDRSARMTTVVKEISLKNNNKWIGWSGEILIDEIGSGALIGRNFAYKPCVLKVPENFLRNKASKVLGKNVSVKVISATPSTLRVSPCSDLDQLACHGQS